MAAHKNSLPPAWNKVKANIPGVFNGVAGTYDLLTALNPGYRKHLRWSADRLKLEGEMRVLDLCCGTGLSTDALLKAYPNATIDAMDASQGMLEKAQRKSWPSQVRFILGNAMDPEASGITGPYHGILMAYGIRNMPDANEALCRVFNLLRPGGRVCFHEYSVADSRRSRLIWRFVADGIIIPSGKLTARKSDIYRYLKRSVLTFDGIKAFEKRLTQNGFCEVQTLPMDGWQKGIVHSFLAERPTE